MTRFDGLIASAREAKLKDPGDPRWSEFLAERIPTSADCSAFIEWATHHPKWLHNVADCADKVCAKPREAAIFLLSDIVAELLDED